VLDFMNLLNPFAGASRRFSIARCERCGFHRARKRWCPDCSSIDPFPRRRLVCRLLLCFVCLALLAACFVFPGMVAKQQLSQEVSKANFLFTKP